MKIKIVIKFGTVDHLYVLNTNESLSVNIENICNDLNLPNVSDYGLKLLETNDGTRINHYVYDENYDVLGNGFKLLLTDSVSKKVNNIIYSIKHNKNKDDAVHELNGLSDDLAFIKELGKEKKYVLLLDMIAQDDANNHELWVYMKILIEMLRLNLITDITPKLLSKIIKLIQDVAVNKSLIAALAVICQLLKTKKGYHHDIKQEILQTLTIENVFKCLTIKSDELNMNNLHLNAITLINTMARLLKNDKKHRFIQKMNNVDNKNLIYLACMDHRDVDKDTAKALNVYQTLALSTMTEKVFLKVIRPQIPIDIQDRLSRNSLISIYDSPSPEYDEEVHKSEIESEKSNARMSLASILSSESGTSSLSIEDVPNKISLLTKECLDHFEKNHQKNYEQASTSDKIFGVDFLSVAERITKTLIKIFRIGLPPINNDFFYPIFFKKNLNKCFFEEIYSRSFWLFIKTKREMNIATEEDYNVLFNVFEHQLGFTLKKRPQDYKELMTYMKESSFQNIAKKIQKDTEWEFLYFLKNHPSINAIKPKITQANQELIYEHRMSILKKGERFPKLGQKKNVYFSISFNKSANAFTWGDWDDMLCKIINPITFYLKDIEFLIVGKACPHVKNQTVKKHEENLAFSLKLRDDIFINFLAKNTETAHYWTDGIYLLLELENRSCTYEKDLETLDEMDLKLNLIELQSCVYKIPNKPPIVPPEPASLPSFDD